jgi:ATP-dependent DNA ligase
MQLHLFDTINESEQQFQRTIQLSQIQLSNPLHFVPHTIVFNFKDLMSLYDNYIAEGYEGFVLRHFDPYYIRRRSLYMMKFKPKKRDQYKITGVYEAISESGLPKGMVGGFNCIDDMNTPFDVGAGKLKHAERKLLWMQYKDDPKSLVGKMLQVEYQTLSDKNKVPHFSRAVEVIL